jgi:hypothetical protein
MEMDECGLGLAFCVHFSAQQVNNKGGQESMAGQKRLR